MLTCCTSLEDKIMWGILVGSLIFVYGIAMQSPVGLSPIGLLVAAIGMTIALMATARYAVDLMAAFVSVKPAVKRTIYDEMGTEPPSAEQSAA